MISAIRGQLHRIDDPGRATVAVGPFVYELLVPAADVPRLQALIGEEIQFHTLLYLEGDPNRGNLEPRLLGFLHAEDKRFFELFTTVKGIGPKTALRALGRPVGQIAGAIESRDARFLQSLDGIGKRTAELIIAQLSGKAGDFAQAMGPGQAAAEAARMARPRPEEDAIAALMALGDNRRAEVEQLLERAKAVNPEARTTDMLLREMLRLRTGRP